MIESKPIGKLVRFILKFIFIAGALALIIGPMLGKSSMSLGEYIGIITKAISTVFGLIVASQASLLARVLVKIKAPSPVLMGIVIAAIIGGFVLGCFIGRLLLNVGAVLCVICMILGILAAVYCTAQTGLLLSLAAVSPLLLSDEDRETLRRNVKNNNIPSEFTTPIGEKVLDQILFEQGLVSRSHIRMSDE